MKIAVVGDGLLANDFKKSNFDVFIFSKFTYERELEWYDTIINTTEYIPTDASVTETSAAYLINAEIPAILSEYCKKKSKKFVQISTADVYENSTNPHNETSIPVPKTTYELTKLFGERYCSDSDLILRVKNLFNESERPDNYLFNLIKNKSIVDIPVSATYTLDVVRAATRLLKVKANGVYNVSSKGLISPHSIASGPQYLTRRSISELNPKNNQINCLCIKKLLEYYTPSDTMEAIGNCIGKLL